MEQKADKQTIPSKVMLILLLSIFCWSNFASATLVSMYAVSDIHYKTAYDVRLDPTRVFHAPGEALVLAKTPELVILARHEPALGDPSKVPLITDYNILGFGESLIINTKGFPFTYQSELEILLNGVSISTGTFAAFDGSFNVSRGATTEIRLQSGGIDFTGIHYTANYTNSFITYDTGNVALEDAISGVHAAKNRTQGENEFATVVTDFEYVAPQLTAAFATGHSVVGQRLSFSANVVDDLTDLFKLPSDAVELLWDFDGDGVFDTDSEYVFNTAGEHQIAVKALNNYGFMSEEFRFSQFVEAHSVSEPPIVLAILVMLWSVIRVRKKCANC